MKPEHVSGEVERFAAEAERYREDEEAREDLLRRVRDKADRAPLGDALEDVLTFIRMIRAYFSGRYREVPWRTIALMIGTCLYLLTPIDLIPDFLPVIGYADDVAVVAFVLRTIRPDIERFREWERHQA